MAGGEKIDVENVNAPGRVTRVNAAKYTAMKAAIFKALPRQAPGLTFDEAVALVKPHLPNALYPAGATSGWWFKTLQLDLEAKGLMQRANTKPLRWWVV